MQAIALERAHVSGLSLGAATGMWLAAKHPPRVKSLSLHSAWPKTDPFLQTVVEGWQVMARALGDVPEMVIQGIFPWCFTPELYASRPDYIQSLADFVRGRPHQPLDNFLQESDAVIHHDAQTALSLIQAPTQITFGRHDLVTSTRFTDSLKDRIRDSEVIVFEDCSHAPIYERGSREIPFGIGSGLSERSSIPTFERRPRTQRRFAGGLLAGFLPTTRIAASCWLTASRSQCSGSKPFPSHSSSSPAPSWVGSSRAAKRSA